MVMCVCSLLPEKERPVERKEPQEEEGKEREEEKKRKPLPYSCSGVLSFIRYIKVFFVSCSSTSYCLSFFHSFIHSFILSFKSSSHKKERIACKSFFSSPVKRNRRMGSWWDFKERKNTNVNIYKVSSFKLNRKIKTTQTTSLRERETQLILVSKQLKWYYHLLQRYHTIKGEGRD